MAILGTLNGASPIDASDDNWLEFTNDLAETLNRALDNTPADFATMDDASWQVEYSLNAAWVDDVYDLDVYIANGATMLAGASSTLADGQRVATNVQNTTDIVSAVTGFTYVNTAADKAAWDGASIYLVQSYAKTKGGDVRRIRVDHVAITGNYTVGAAVDNLLAADVESTSEVSSPELTQSHILTADDVEIASEVSSPAMGQVHTLTMDDVESTSEVSSPVLAEVGLDAVAIARYLLNEAATGQSPSTCADDTGNGNGLAISWDSTHLSWTSIVAGRGLDWSDPTFGTTAIARLADIVTNGNLGSSLDGSKTAAIVAVVEVDSGNGSIGRIVAITQGTNNGDFALVSDDQERPGLRWDNNNGIFFPSITSPGIYLVIVNVDSSQITPSDRVKMSYNGVDQSSVTGVWPALDSTLSLNTSTDMCIGNRPNDFARPNDQKNYWVGIYDKPLTAQQITDAQSLLTNNDVDWEDAGDNLLADDVENASEVSTPALTQAHILLVGNVESNSEVSNPELTQEHTLLADDVESASEISTPAVSESHALTANDIGSGTEITAPTITQIHALTVDDVESNSEVTAPSITQAHTLLADDAESVSEVSAPILAEAGHALLADDVESISEVSTPVLAEVYNLFANDIESTSEVGIPALAQIHQLFATDVETSSEVTNPVLTEEGTDVLLADNIESVSEITTPSISQVHAILADDTESTSEVSNPVLVESGADALLADNVESGSEVTAPPLAQVHQLFATDVETSSEVTNPLLTEEGTDVLLADNIESVSEITTPSISQVHAILADDTESTSEVSNPVLVESGPDALLADNVESSSEVTTPSLAQVHQLFANDIESNSEISNPSISDVLWPTVINNVKVRSIEKINVFNKSEQITIRSKTNEIKVRSIS